ncbi:FmdB family zinc ribbon protein [Desulfatiglans anilini]|uniref:FmdB family zinc ribbon protein n=1 Tax=Desulfatiglans anilini TaxID=90728 RepID=UPI00041F64EF|nr:zinc ribbon domain-containing protein [Desulfatiglans anilini]
MPIYEYEACDLERACARCRRAFEVLQSMKDPLLERCPACGAPVRKLVSRFRAAVAEPDEGRGAVETRIKEYEQQGLWSHAAELADTHAAKAGDDALKMRAIDDYRKAGYPLETLEKHAKTETE